MSMNCILKNYETYKSCYAYFATILKTYIISTFTVVSDILNEFRKFFCTRKENHKTLDSKLLNFCQEDVINVIKMVIFQD